MLRTISACKTVCAQGSDSVSRIVRKKQGCYPGGYHCAQYSHEPLIQEMFADDVDQRQQDLDCAQYARVVFRSYAAGRPETPGSAPGSTTLDFAR